MHDQAAVNAAGEEGAQRNVGDQLIADALRQQAVGFLDQCFPVGSVCRRVGNGPPLARGGLAAALPAQAGAGRQDVDVAHEGARRQRRLKGEVVAQAFGIELFREGREGEEGREGRRRDEVFTMRAGMYAPEQGLDAEPVASQKDAAILRVVDGEGEHAVELAHHGLAPVQVAGQQHLAV